MSLLAELEKRAVWNKAIPVQGYNANTYRKDRFGFWISYAEYGLTSKYGWEKDHIIPRAASGSDALTNLQPLHWRNNRAKSDHFPG